MEENKTTTFQELLIDLNKGDSPVELSEDMINLMTAFQELLVGLNGGVHLDVLPDDLDVLPDDPRGLIALMISRSKKVIENVNNYNDDITLARSQIITLLDDPVVKDLQTTYRADIVYIIEELFTILKPVFNFIIDNSKTGHIKKIYQVILCELLLLKKDMEKRGEDIQDELIDKVINNPNENDSDDDSDDGCFANEIMKEQWEESLTLLSKFVEEINRLVMPLKTNADRKCLMKTCFFHTLPTLKELLSYRLRYNAENSLEESVDKRFELINLYDKIMSRCPFEKESPKYLKYRYDVIFSLPFHECKTDEDFETFITNLINII